MLIVFIFFFKQKTAYEMRISDWSSDVCSSDLTRTPAEVSDPLLLEWIVAIAIVDMLPVPTPVGFPFSLSFPLQLSVALIYPAPEIGRASCRERVCQYV